MFLFLLDENPENMPNELRGLVIVLSIPEIKNSLSDFCAEHQIDERSKRTLSGLFTLFSRVAISIDIPDSKYLVYDFLTIANNLSLLPKLVNPCSCPIYRLANSEKLLNCDFNRVLLTEFEK